MLNQVSLLSDALNVASKLQLLLCERSLIYFGRDNSNDLHIGNGGDSDSDTFDLGDAQIYWWHEYRTFSRTKGATVGINDWRQRRAVAAFA